MLRKEANAVPTSSPRQLIIQKEAMPTSVVPVWRRLLVTHTVLITLLALCCGGAVLNRCRGGMLNFSKYVSYWPAHALSRLMMALPTGIIAGLVSRKFSVFIIVTVTTWCTLFVGWGCYFTIGSNPKNYATRSGAFDWLIGRSEAQWHYSRRVLREYVGMSLRGLVWTAPQGYALHHLGHGTMGYSLAGSLMALVYFSTNKIRKGQFCDGIACSEYVWGYVVWFTLLSVLMKSSLNKDKHNSPETLEANPDHEISKMDKLKNLLKLLFTVVCETIHILLTIIFAISIAFYALVEQLDVANKAQTFFGMQTGFLFLFSSQIMVWTSLITERKRRKSIHERSAQIQSGEPWTLPVNTEKELANSDKDNEIRELNLNQAVPDEITLIGYLHPCERFIKCLIKNSYINCLFKIISYIILWLSLLSTIITLLLAIYTGIQNKDSPRLINCTAVCQYH